ncbi:phytanoyl-CoA dioxygenase family protein [Halopseudomonas sabulinigri]|uniref:Phytanoyl-CoA dioxygenase family protein n=2 Tax=Halopseudomonas sabulinigri TaxID=472181 RepID=A0ABP9ZQQ9_9GAMM
MLCTGASANRDKRGNGMTQRVLSGDSEYLKSGYAKAYPSTAGSQAAVSVAELERLHTALLRDGYVILERVVGAAEVERIRQQLRELLPEHCGRNGFEGTLTQRLYGVIAKTLACNPLVEHPLVLGLLDRVLSPNYLLSQLQVINILPGERAQPLHHDDAFYPVPRPRPHYGAATIIALDDFTADNGATVVIPGSHTWDGHAPTAQDCAQAIPVIMPKGSMVLFLGTLWHGGGANHSALPRLAATAQYCEPWARQQENFSLSVPLQRARECSPHLQRMLGYSIHPPFMGMVNGMHPRRLLDGKPQ